MIAKRTEYVEYAIRDIVMEAKKLEKEGKKLLYFNIGDPVPYGFSPPEHVMKALSEAALNPKIKGYAPSKGDPELLKAVAEMHKTEEENVFITTGLSEAIDFLYFSLTEKSEYILLEDPAYPLYLTKARVYSRGPLLADYTNEDDIRKKIKNKKIKAIVIISPNNPTGRVYSEKELKVLVDIAGELKAPIFYDGAYDMLSFVPLPDFKRIAKDVPFIYGQSVSKNFIFPGARVGWVVFHGELGKLKNSFEKLCNQRLSISAEMQKAAVAAVRGPKDHVEEFKKELLKRRDAMARVIEDNPVLSAEKPNGAFYYWIKFDAKMDDWEFVRKLMREEGIVSVPGSAFGSSKKHFRVVYLPTMEQIEEFGRRMERFVSSF
ncbi:MAG: aminotransferase class I/II-fold pyridoxal phosphate-dependent enzyme [Candidatus Anstonellales archaeon]